jgi:glycosyltransferase involved in cell wall biosynthesis
MTTLPHSIARSPSFGAGAASARPFLRAKKLSVVVPCYNELGSLPELVRRLNDTCTQCVGDDYELILINDCSTDETWAEILRLSAGTHQLIGVDLAHKHGHQLALTAGLFVASGDRVMIIDADLQDPPELLAEMMARLDAGADVAYGQRLQRKGESWFKKTSAATPGIFAS